MAGDYRIRPATEADLPAIVDIEGAVFSDPWPLVAFQRALTGTLTVAVAADAVVGYLIAHHAADVGEILNVAVHPDRHRQGIGGALVEDVLWRLAGDGVVSVFLEVRESNTAAQKLYESLEFECVGVRRGYYRKPMEDAVVMRLSSIEHPTPNGRGSSS